MSSVHKSLIQGRWWRNGHYADKVGSEAVADLVLEKKRNHGSLIDQIDLCHGTALEIGEQ